MQFTLSLHRAARLRPKALACVCGNRRLTHRQLRDRVARLAAAMSAIGLRSGDRIAMLGLNSDHYLEYYLAVPWIGGVVNPVNFRWSLDEIVYSLNDSASVALFIDSNFVVHADTLRARCPQLRVLIYCGDDVCPDGLLDLEALIAAHAPIDDLAANGDALYGVFYTGGTTGRSKGVLLSHANLGGSALAMLGEGLFREGCSGLHTAPMFHLAGMMQTACLLLRGGTHVMLPAFKPDAVLGLVAAERITDLLLVPAMLQAVIDAPRFAEFDTSSVRNLLYGAAPASEALLDRAMQALPNTDFYQVYGMTELSATISVLRPEVHRAQDRSAGRLRSAGRGFIHLDLRVVDAQERECPRGTIGEIVVRGPNVMQGYLNQPEATASAVRDGWLHSGDLGYMDEDGYLFVVDRLKDMIVSGGENVYSAEVENAIAQHPAVAACAVIGIPSEEWGESVHAAIVLRAGSSLTEASLAAHCRRLIAGYKCPRSIELRDSLPLTGAGKVLKLELRAPFWKHRSRAVN